MTIPTRRALIMLAASFACGGCGGAAPVWVGGKVTRGGSAYVPPEGHRLEVTLRAVDVKDVDGNALSDEPFQAQVDQKQGTFVVPGKEGRGILPGKYRVTIAERPTREALRKAEQTDPRIKRPARKAPDVDRDTDFFKGRFGPGSSPILVDVKGPRDMVIDLDRAAETSGG